MTIIGRKYTPTDNSYSINITNPTKKHDGLGIIMDEPLLAGSMRGHPKIITTIKSNPFNIYKEFCHKVVYHSFIIVEREDTKESFVVLYNKKGLQPKE